VLVELSRRSTDADRGSAFALFSGGLATAMSLGSVGGAPLVALFGLSAALVVGIALIGVAIVSRSPIRPCAGGWTGGPTPRRCRLWPETGTGRASGRGRLGRLGRLGWAGA
jgi:hypothetical protein